MATLILLSVFLWPVGFTCDLRETASFLVCSTWLNKWVLSIKGEVSFWLGLVTLNSTLLMIKLWQTVYTYIFVLLSQQTSKAIVFRQKEVGASKASDS